MKALLAGLLFCLSALAAGQEAGKIDFIEGAVRLYDGQKQERRAEAGGPVNAGDTIETAGDGEVHLAMADGGQLAIRPNTHFKIQKYKAEGSQDDTSVFSLVKGAMRSITGWIGKYNSKNYEIRTPTATIGVRGTDHETRVIPEGSGDGEAGTYDKVNAGATRLTTRFGSADIGPNQAGFFSALGRARPRILGRVPDFFRPTRNEQRIEGLHEKIRGRLDQRRQERIREMTAGRGARRQGLGGERTRDGGRGDLRRQQLERRRDLRENRREHRLERTGRQHESAGLSAPPSRAGGRSGVPAQHAGGREGDGRPPRGERRDGQAGPHGGGQGRR